MSSRLPTHVYVSAAVQQAAGHGATVTVLRKGDAERGALLIKTNNLAGRYALYMQIFDGQQTQFMQLVAPTGDEGQVGIAIQRALDTDPDTWAIEIEDRRERLWFDQQV